jgi:hypothetical protein
MDEDHFERAPIERFSQYGAEIAKILAALGHPEAMVTDELRLSDFPLREEDEGPSLTELGIDLGGRDAPTLLLCLLETIDQGTSIESLQEIVNGWRENAMLAKSHVLVDEGISGTTMERPGLRKLRDLVNAHAIVAVVAYDPDRLSRNPGHQLLLAEDFERASVKLLIVSHPMEQGPEGWLFFQIGGALAEYGRAKLWDAPSHQ